MSAHKKKKSEDGVATAGAAAPVAAVPVVAKKAALARNDEDEDFPRGGSVGLTPLEYREVQREAERDVLFEMAQSGGVVPAGPVAGATTTKKAAKKDAAAGEPQAKKTKLDSNAFVSQLRFKRLAVGMVLLGAIVEVHELDLVVSLPNNLVGHVAITDISDALSAQVEKASGQLAKIGETEEDEDEEDAMDAEAAEDEDAMDAAPAQKKKSSNGKTKASSETKLPDLKAMFTVGQLVQCSVLTVEAQPARKKLDLSINPTVINSGLGQKDIQAGQIICVAIKSREDHGYALDLGIADVTGFLPTDKTSGDALHVGQVLTTTIQAITASGRAVTVASNTMAMTSTSSKFNAQALTLDAIRAGQLGQARVTAATSRGLTLSFLSLFEASADAIHIEEEPATEHGKEPRSLEERFPVGTKVRTRVLYVDMNLRHVSVSLKPSVVGWETIAFPKQLNINKSKVPFEVGTILEQAVVTRVDAGTALILHHPSLTVPLYAYITRVSDTPLEKFTKVHRLGSSHTCRVVGLNYLDGFALVSMQESILSKPFLSVANIRPGSIVEGHVLKTGPFGIIVDISDHIRGLVPTRNVADVPLRNIAKKFTPGSKISCVVLYVDTDKKKIILSNQRSLIQSDLPKLLTKADAKPGLVTLAYITGVAAKGLYIRFYNNMKGFVAKKEIDDLHAANLSESFFVGKTLKVKVIRYDVKGASVIATAKTTDALPQDRTEENAAKTAHILPGEISAGLVKAKRDGRIYVTLTSVNPPVDAILSNAHLGDVAANSDAIYEGAEPGKTEIDEVMVLSKDKYHNIYATAKPSVIAAHRAGALPCSIEQLTRNTVYVGYVRQVADFGYFIGFLGDLIALAPKMIKHENSFSAPYIGQTVRAFIKNIDDKAQKVTASLQPSQCASTDGTYLANYFAETAKVASSVHSATTVPSYKIGQVATATVLKAHLLSLPNTDFKVSVHKPHGNTVGQSVDVVILDIDVAKKNIDVSLSTDLVASRKAVKPKAEANALKNLDKETPLSVQVELLKHDYVIVSIPSLNSALAFVSTKDYNALNTPIVDKYKEGSKFESFVHRGDQPVAGRLVLYVKAPAPPTNPQKAAKQFSIGSADSRLTSLEDITIGLKTKAVVNKVNDDHILVNLTSAIYGRIHATAIVDKLSVVKAGNVFGSIKKGDTVDVKVLGFSYRSAMPKTLAITKTSALSNMVINLSMKPSDLALPDGTPSSSTAQADNLEKGQIIQAIIKSIGKKGIVVSVAGGLHGFVYAIDASPDFEIVKKLDSKFKPKQLVQGILLTDASHKTKSANEPRFLMRLLADKAAKFKDPAQAIGSLVNVRVAEIDETTGLTVQLAHTVEARVPFTELADTFKTNPTSAFKVGQILQAVMIHNEADDKSKNHLSVSLRESLVKWAQSDEAKVAKSPAQLKSALAKVALPSPIKGATAVRSFADVQEGGIVAGYVKSSTDKGVFVHIAPGVVARIRISELSDKFVKDWTTSYTPGRLVRGKVIHVDKTNRHIDITLKRSQVLGARASADLTWTDLKEGMKLDGKIRKIETFGVFISFDNSKLSGLCHKSELSDEPVEDIASLYTVGDPVRVAILSIDEEKKRLSLGLKQSYFENDDDEMDFTIAYKNAATKRKHGQDDDDEEEEDGEDEDEEEGFTNGQFDDEDEEEEDVDADLDEEEEQEDEEQEDMDVAPAKASGPLDVKAGFAWDDGFSFVEPSKTPDHDSDDEDDGDEEGESANSKSKKSKREKKRQRDETEARIAAQEEALIDNAGTPQSSEDFDRLIIANPNSSFLWIKYMAFQLGLTEIEKARAVAERALKTINFREEQEKLNIWVAHMNLENSYGTQESLMKVFEKAVQYNNPKKIYIHLVKIYERTEKLEAADELYKVMIKKFRESSKVWVQYCLFALRLQKDADGARKLLDRSLKSLPKRKHVKTICKYAQMEFKFGEVERGRTIFEGMLNSYPKRADLWSIYVDMEDKSGDAAAGRRLLERIVHLKWSSKKMKFFFKRYLDFETRHGGSAANIEHVKDLARNYVESSM